MVLRRLEDRRANIFFVELFRCKPEHPVVELPVERGQKVIALVGGALDNDHAELFNPPFLAAFLGAVILIELAELSHDGRFTINVMSHLRALNLKEVVERILAFRLRWIGNGEHCVRVHGAFQVVLLPVKRKISLRTELF